MRTIRSTIIRSLLGSGLLAGATYFALGSNGFLMQLTGIDLGYLQLPVYLFALAQVLTTITPLLPPLIKMGRQGGGRELWRYLVAIGLRGASRAFLAFVLLGGIPLFLAGLAGRGGLETHPYAANLGERLSPYLLHLSRLNPWVIGYIALMTLYEAASVYPVRQVLPAIYRSRLDRHRTRPGKDLFTPVRVFRLFGLGMAAVFLLLGQSGWISQGTGLDVSFLALPLYLALLFFLLSGLLELVAMGAWTRTPAVIFSGGAWVILAQAFFSGLPLLLEQLESKQAAAELARWLAPYAAHTASLRFWSIALIAVVTVYRVAAQYITPLVRGDEGGAPLVRGDYRGVPRRRVIRSPVNTVVTNNLLAAPVFLFLHPNGYIHLLWGLDLGALQLPFYGFFGMRLAGDLAGYFGRGLWRYALHTGLRGGAVAFLGFFLLRGIPDFVSALLGNRYFGPTGRFLDPYLEPLVPLAYWLVIHVSLVTIYYATAPYWKPPVSPLSEGGVKGGLSWAYARLGKARPEPFGFAQGKLRRRDEAAPVRSLNRSALLALVTYLALGPSGLVGLWTGLYFPFLSPPIYGLAGALLASNLVKMLGAGQAVGAQPRLVGVPLLSGLLFWGGLSQLAYLLLDNLTRVGIEMVSTPRYTPAGEVVLPYLVMIGKLDVWVASFLGLAGLYKSSAAYWKQDKYAAYQPMLQATTMLLLGGIAWGALGSLTPIGQPYSGLGAVAFSAFAAVSIGHLASYTKDHPQPLVATLSLWAVASPLRNANLGAFIAFYSLVIRPALYTAFIYAPLLEWGGVLLLGLYILRGSWGLISNPSSPPFTKGGTGGILPPQPPIWPTFERHKPAVSIVPDRAFEPVHRAQQSFMASGNRSPILAYLVTVLWDNQVPVERIGKIIAPLASHTDPAPPHWLRFIRAFPIPLYPPLRRRGYRRAVHFPHFEDRLVKLRGEVLHQVQESLESAAGGLDGFYPNGPNPPSPPSQGGAGEDSLWRWAEDSFIESGDMTGLATAVTIETRPQRAARRPAVDLIDKLFQYHDAHRRWYHLPGQRHRLAEKNRNNRQALTVYLKSQISHQRSAVSNQLPHHSTPVMSPSGESTLSEVEGLRVNSAKGVGQGLTGPITSDSRHSRS